MNYFYGIPHFCSSVALERDGVPLAAAVYDPMREELYSAGRGGGALLNGRPVTVSSFAKASEAVVVCGFMKDEVTIRAGVEAFAQVIHKVRKVRVTGSAALDLAYVAAGRFTAYYESGIRHWDIAAGRLLLEEAGGRFDEAAVERDHTLNVFASNGLVHDELAPYFPLR
jgi:myo-inositol-1(or 4)-monophosphatase